MKYFKLLLILLLPLLFITSCDKKDPITDIEDKDKDKKPPVAENNNKYVNDWIFETMNIYYFWNSTIPQKPDYTLASDLFFNSLLSKYNQTSNPNGDRFSWIQEDYVDLLNSLSGVSADEIGFEFVRVQVSKATPIQYYLLVLYPKPGTDAEAKGVRKGQFIIQINGQDITAANYDELLKGTGSRDLKIAEWFDAGGGKLKLDVTNEVTVQMHSNYAENPVYLDSVYTVPNGKKVGYLVYNFFARDRGDGSYDYDADLMKTLERIDSHGVTEMVLDLRYNGGGAVSSAVALASALVPTRNVDEVFSYVEYNPIVHAALERQEGKNFNKDYFMDEIKVSGSKSIPIPSMNLNKLYVLVSRWSASASEMVINGLKPYFGDNIILIGETTVGKNVGSVSFYEEDDPKNKWGMQPIIAKFFNKDGESDFTAGFVPNYEVHEIDDDLFLYEFGDIYDKMLNKALTLANGGQALHSVPQKAPRLSAPHGMKHVRGSSSILEKPGRNTLNDDVRGEEIRKLNLKD